MNFLYNFDLIGPNPELYIFRDKRYKSLISLLLSFIIILFSIVFTLYSTINYFRFDRPTITYSKSNDNNEYRQIYLKDTLMMFQYIDAINFEKINDSKLYFDAEYTAVFFNGTGENIKLNVENCKLGKNLNAKYTSFYKERINKLNSDFSNKDKNIEDFYCINIDKKGISLFYQPSIGYSYININLILKNKKEYPPENINVMFIYENILINHDSKNSPLSEGISYQFISGFSSDEYSMMDFIFQFLKYETDDGLFLDNLYDLYGMSFLETTYYKSKQLSNDFVKEIEEKNNTFIGALSFSLNI